MPQVCAFPIVKSLGDFQISVSLTTKAKINRLEQQIKQSAMPPQEQFACRELVLF